MKQSIIFILAFIFFTLGLYSQNGWIELQHGINSQEFKSVHFVNENTGYVVGTVGVIKTTNSGLNWQLVYNNTTGMILNSIHSINGDDILVAAKGGSANPSAIVLWSNDGGYFWTVRFTGAIFTSFFKVLYLNSMTAFALGSNGQAYKTTNSGSTWESLNLNVNNTFYDIEFSDTQNGFISGNGINFKSTNGGLTWVYNIGTGGVLSMVNNSQLYQYTLSGNQVGLKRTTNGGVIWYSVIPYILSNLSDICFVNYFTGYAVGNTQNNNVLMKSTNAGVNWHSQIDSNGWLQSLYFINELTGYAVGNLNSGVIFKTTTGGVTIGISSISTEIPKQFSLSQNYPNPFNPSTKIKFDISGTSAAQTFLSVYDIMGREVEVLVNEQLSPGQYQVDWNANSYPSGVYYYKITAGSFTETKKMVLVK